MGTKIPPETCEEHMKLEQCKDAYKTVRHFAEWLKEQGYVIGRCIDMSRAYARTTCDILTYEMISEVIYSYFGVNSHKLHEEFIQLKESGDEYQSPVEEG